MRLVLLTVGDKLYQSGYKCLYSKGEQEKSVAGERLARHLAAGERLTRHLAAGERLAIHSAAGERLVLMFTVC